MQSAKLSLGTPKFNEDKQNFLSLIMPNPSREHAQRCTIISYMIDVIFLCDRHSPVKLIVCCCHHPTELCEELSCSFAFQLAENRAGKALYGLLRVKLEWNVGLFPEEKMDRR